MALFVVGQFWLHEHDKRVKADVRAEATAAQSDSLARVLATRDKEMARQDSVTVVIREQLKEQQIRLATTAVAAQEQTSSAVANLRRQLSADMKPMLDSIIRGYEKQLAIKDEQLAAQRKLTDLAEAQVASRDSTLAAIRRLNQSISAELDLANKRGNKSLQQKVAGGLPWLAVGIVLGSRIH